MMCGAAIGEGIGAMTTHLSAIGNRGYLGLLTVDELGLLAVEELRKRVSNDSVRRGTRLEWDQLDDAHEASRGSCSGWCSIAQQSTSRPHP